MTNFQNLYPNIPKYKKYPNNLRLYALYIHYIYNKVAQLSPNLA